VIDDRSAESRILAGSRVTKLSEIAHGAGVAAVVVSDPATVRWLGVEEPERVVVVVGGGEGRLVAPPESEEAAGPDPLGRALAEIGIAEGEPLAGELGPRSGWLDLTREISQARAVKEPDEVARIAAATELVGMGHRALRTACEPGRSELELWAAARAELEAAAGGPVDAAVDLMAGERTALVGEPPGESRVKRGDPVLFDLAPRLHGYWADSCTTFVCGVAKPEIRRRHGAVAAALERGLEAARPGVTAAAVDAAIRDRLAAANMHCPHHTGHGVGTAAQEPPWLVRDDQTVLETGMVLAFEPGAYGDGFGVRLEHLAVIEPQGARPLTQHSLSLVREEGV
jgi:Xaa-Pro aminopeptidase